METTSIQEESASRNLIKTENICSQEDLLEQTNCTGTVEEEEINAPPWNASPALDSFAWKLCTVN